MVPAKDEALNLPLLFEKFAEQMSSRRLRGEVIIVDDGSTDGTYEVARAGAAQYRWLRVKRHPTNLGLTAALKTGFDAARNDIMLFWPADLQSAWLLSRQGRFVEAEEALARVRAVVPDHPEVASIERWIAERRGPENDG